MTSPFTLTPIRAKTKGEVKRLRKAGFTPVSLQHKGAETQHYQQATRPLAEFIQQHGDGTMLDLLVLPDTRHRAILQNIQRDPFTQKLLQVTFQLIQQEDHLKTHVPIVFEGEQMKGSGDEVMMQHQVNRLDIECEQGNLPDHITVDISHLRLGDVMRVSDLPVNPLYKILTAPDTVLASLSSTRFGKEPETTAENAETTAEIA